MSLQSCDLTQSPSIPRATTPRRSWAMPIAGAIASGLLLAGCYWPFELHFLAWIALVPAALALSRAGPKAAWLIGALTGLTFYTVGLWWLPSVYGAKGAAVIGGLALWMAFSFHIMSLLMRRFGARAILWAVPLCFCAQEIIRSEGLPLHRFSQLELGYSQGPNLWIAQIASLGGVHLVGFLLAASGSALAYGLIRRRLRSFVPLAALATLVVALGAISQPGNYDHAPRFAVVAVQDESHDLANIGRLARQAATAAAVPAFIVFPEHTIAQGPPAAEDRLPMLGELKALAASTGACISVGVHTLPQPTATDNVAANGQPRNTVAAFPIALEALAAPPCEFDNANLLLGPAGVIGKQLKSVPMPFWPDGNPATTQQTFATPHGRVGLYVCFDESFSDVMRRLSDKGAGLLLGNIYNGLDWPVQQRMQQANMMAFRAIELRRCMVRATSSGVSQIIEADGRVQAQRLKSEGPGVLRGTAYLNYERTFFARAGYLFAPILGLTFLAAVPLLTAQRVFRRSS